MDAAGVVDAMVARFDAVPTSPDWRQRADAAVEALDARGLRKAGRVGIEVGAWKGDFSRALLRPPSALTLHLVDRWATVPPYKHQTRDLRHANRTIHERNYAAVEALRDSLPLGHVVLHANSSLNAAAKFAHSSVDFVYLDADHRREAVERDLKAWWPTLTPDGVLLGHDFGPLCVPHKCVRGAVDAFLGGRQGVHLARLPGQQFLLHTGERRRH